MDVRPRAVARLDVNHAFWRDRRVLVTGHTGFKGTWLTEWLNALGSEVTGFSLPEHDVRDRTALEAVMGATQPEVVVHLAAQAQVRASYDDPVATFTTNVTGTAHVLEAVRATPSVRVAVLASSDKCYAQPGGSRAFREDDRLGGHDPYAASKAAAELVAGAYRASYFAGPDGPRVVSIRAGNVIGGGDRASDRLVPDLVRAFRSGEPACVRYPDATRPWQFVLDALHGYLLAAERACLGQDVPPALNIGPPAEESRTVRWLADSLAARWGDGASWHAPAAHHPHEASHLAIDSTLARESIGWRPLLSVDTAVSWTVDWYRAEGSTTTDQIREFMKLTA